MKDIMMVHMSTLLKVAYRAAPAMAVLPASLFANPNIRFIEEKMIVDEFLLLGISRVSECVVFTGQVSL